MDQRARGLNVRVSITASLMNISVPDWYSRRGFKNLGCDGSQGPQADGDVRCWWFLFIKPRIQLKRAIQWVVWCYWMGVYSLRSIWPTNGNFVSQEPFVETNFRCKWAWVRQGPQWSPVMSTPEKCFLSIGQMQCIAFGPHTVTQLGQWGRSLLMVHW